ncbi:hypothetical protein CEPID_11695 [Corynebacterium epidermidicanis]|uniref:Uncharacterized protein n=1 Tax=Corynebacterium epidermidicanis TaxID=1050174 RepID=A0A0G3GZD7_9CORY|nr:hypothetical protein CEPID_11695 [Corynebacterium epidermidicanis]
MRAVGKRVVIGKLVDQVLRLGQNGNCGQCVVSAAVATWDRCDPQPVTRRKRHNKYSKRINALE